MKNNKIIALYFTEQEVHDLDNKIKTDFVNIKISRNQYIKKLVLDKLSENKF